MPVEKRVIYKHIDVDGWNASIEKYVADGGYEILAQTVRRDRWFSSGTAVRWSSPSCVSGAIPASAGGNLNGAGI